MYKCYVCKLSLHNASGVTKRTHMCRLAIIVFCFLLVSFYIYEFYNQTNQLTVTTFHIECL